MKMVAIVLGGGQGRRLFPLTRDRSKPAVPIGGKYRLVDIPISNSLYAGIKNIFVLTQFNSSSLNNHILNTYKFDYFSRSSVTLLAAEQTLSREKWFQGTADAVRCHIPHYHLEPDDEVLVLSEDHLYRMDFKKMFDFHRKRKAEVTISVASIAENEVHQFGVLKAKKTGMITDFVEKPKTEQERKGLDCEDGRYLISMGIYLFKASVLMRLLKGNEADFGKEVIPKAIQSCRSYAYHFDGYWRDIGTIRSFFQANLELTGPNPKFSFYSPREGSIFTHPRFLPPSRLDDSSIHSSLVSEGCVIKKSSIKDSVIGLRSVVQENVSVSRSIIMGADFYALTENMNKLVPVGVGKGSHIENAIIDKNACIGKKVVIKNAKQIETADSEQYYIREGIVIVPKNAVIPDKTVI